MSGNIIQLNEQFIHNELKTIVKNSVEETLNALLDAEADKLVQAERYARDQARKGYRVGHYERSFSTQAGDVTLKVPKLRCWGGSFENASVLVAIGVTEDGYREVIGTAEGLKEDTESWKNFFVWMKSRGLDGVKLIIGDKNLGMVESIGEVFPNARYQRCTVHMYRNIFSVVPRKTVKEVSKMLKAIHAQENKAAAKEKAKSVIFRLREMKLNKAADKLENGLEETLTYMEFPSEHWLRIRTNNVIERVNREIKRRTRLIGTFPDGESALMLVCARLRYIASNDWGKKRYLNMKHLTDMLAEELYCEAKIS